MRGVIILRPLWQIKFGPLHWIMTLPQGFFPVLAIGKIAWFGHSLGKVQRTCITYIATKLTSYSGFCLLLHVPWSHVFEFVHFTFKFSIQVVHFGGQQPIGNFWSLFGKKDTIWHWDWVLIMDPNWLENKRPKGPHIVHLSTMCHLFEESAKADIFVYWSARKTQTRKRMLRSCFLSSFVEFR